MAADGIDQASDAPDARAQWAAEMRLKLSPPAMLEADGSIRQSYFKPKHVLLVDERRWGAEERELLYQGIEKHGVGQWRDIGAEFLPRWDDTTLRLKTARLLGSQSLARYMRWRGDRAAVDAEHAANRAIGEATGCWKAAVLVEDDAGSVAAALAARGPGGGAGVAAGDSAAEDGVQGSVPDATMPDAADVVKAPAAAEPHADVKAHADAAAQDMVA